MTEGIRIRAGTRRAAIRISRTGSLLALLAAVLVGPACQMSYVARVDSVVNNPAGGGVPGSAGSPAPARAAGANVQTASASVGGGDGTIESYTIRNRNAGTTDESLRYREAVGYIRTALSTRGWFEASIPSQADIVIEVDYGLDEPRTRVEERVVPIYANSGGGVRYEERIFTRPDGTVEIRSVPVYDPPGTQLVGEQLILVPITTYEKYLRITATDNLRNGSSPQQLWSVTVTNEDESNDLRRYLPILVSAAIDHLGQSNGQTTVRLTDNSEDVAFIRGSR
jgi:hypothetical protein